MISPELTTGEQFLLRKRTPKTKKEWVDYGLAYILTVLFLTMLYLFFWTFAGTAHAAVKQEYFLEDGVSKKEFCAQLGKKHAPLEMEMLELVTAMCK